MRREGWKGEGPERHKFFLNRRVYPYSSRNAKEGGKKSSSSISKSQPKRVWNNFAQSPFDSTQITRTRATFFSFAFASSSSTFALLRTRPGKQGPADKTVLPVKWKLSQQKTNSMLGIVFSDP